MELLPPEVSERSDTPDSWRSLRRVQQNILDLWRGEAQPELDCRTGEQRGIPLDGALSDTSDDTDDDDEAEVTGAVASSGAIVRLAPAAAAARRRSARQVRTEARSVTIHCKTSPRTWASTATRRY